MSLSPGVVREAVRIALREDLDEHGDITTKATIPQDHSAKGYIEARQEGVVAGLPLVSEVFAQIAPSASVRPLVHDGDRVRPQQSLVAIEGPAASILTAERTALNFLGHLSGIASATRKLVDAIQGTGATILDTRKTTPGLRILEKYAVRMGGGQNHRIGLYDGVLIKDNHIAVAGGVAEAIRKARLTLGHEVPIEVEVENLEQLEAALAESVLRVLLDNMDFGMLREAAAMAKGRAETEASGGVNLERVRAIAETGVDFISVGQITHSAPNLDVALEIDPS